MPNMEIKPLETQCQRLFIPNAMLLLYLGSVGLGLTVTMIIGHFTVGFFEGQLLTAFRRYGPYYDLPIAIITVFIILVYERPIRRVFHSLDPSKVVTAGELRAARRRLLNEPFFLIALDLLTWLGAAGYYSLLIQRFAARPELARLLAVNSLLTAVISVVTTFFFLQYGLQRWLIPVFFPQGGLSRVRGAWRITLSTRLAALVMATSLVPLFIIGVSLFGTDVNDLTGRAAHSLPNLLSDIIFVELVLFTLMAIILTYLVAGNMSRPFHAIIMVLAQIKKGHLDRRVRVVSNDEIGYTGDAINAMAAGLEEREKMRQSLYLAREVQQSLLPLQAPRIPNVDLSGQSLYCDETGGDYYDYIRIERNDNQKTAVVIGDVSGHGVSSALLMTSIRAYLRALTRMLDTPADIINNLNRLVSVDTEETAQFMTLFYLEVDHRTRTLVWVRAGHEPAYLYQPDTDSFEELGGQGLALGVDQEWQYQTYAQVIRSGQLLLMTTDGIFETRHHGQMFGKKRFKEVVRRHHDLNAAGIRKAILAAVDGFRGPERQEDDVTLVVMKFL